MRTDLARALAGGFLAAEWTRAGLVDGGAAVIGRRVRWMPALVREVLDVYPRAPRDRPRELAAVIAAVPAAAKAGRTGPAAYPLAAVRMLHNPWRLVVLHDLSDVAALLEVSQPELAWFSDPLHWARAAERAALQHYRVSTRNAPSGAIRVLEAPKSRLKAIQRRLLHEIVGRIPPHDAAHGFRTGRSVASYAAPHAGRDVVIRSDLEGFFASVTVGRVYGVLRTAGYPEPVAHCLAGLMTTVLPCSLWRRVPKPTDPDLHGAHWRLGRRLAAPHLPQGAPTSPALANLAAYRLDVRLAGLAASWGGQYTRYADDLALSGDRGWHARSTRLLGVVGEIARAEGFRLNARKTAILPRSGRQVLGGLVVNDSPHVSRAEVDVLRAIVHNCLRAGPSAHNRDQHVAFQQHLDGRISWIEQHDPARGARLRSQFRAIDWSR